MFWRLVGLKIVYFFFTSVQNKSCFSSRLSQIQTRMPVGQRLNLRLVESDFENQV